MEARGEPRRIDRPLADDSLPNWPQGQSTMMEFFPVILKHAVIFDLDDQQSELLLGYKTGARKWFLSQ